VLVLNQGSHRQGRVLSQRLPQYLSKVLFRPRSLLVLWTFPYCWLPLLIVGCLSCSLRQHLAFLNVRMSRVRQAHRPAHSCSSAVFHSNSELQCFEAPLKSVE
jgi:hypothetical protein